MQTVELYLENVRTFIFSLLEISGESIWVRETEEKTEGTSREEKIKEEERRVENRAEDKRGEAGGER